MRGVEPLSAKPSKKTFTCFLYFLTYEYIITKQINIISISREVTSVPFSITLSVTLSDSVRKNNYRSRHNSFATIVYAASCASLAPAKAIAPKRTEKSTVLAVISLLDD